MVPVGEAIREAAQQLARTSETARLDAEWLMAHALGVSRSDLLLRHGEAAVPAAFTGLIARRMRHEPLAYIIGEAEFYGRSFTVNPAVLIPRGDSECVVEAALEIAPAKGRVLDLGTGSGCLLLTILAQRDGLHGVGVDASVDALQVAALNAARLGLSQRARILRRDWHEHGWADDLGRFELVIANPPYVEQDAVLDPDVRDFEPAAALFAGPEGLDDYRAIMPQLQGLLAPDGVAVLEIGAGQADAVGGIARACGHAVEMRRDLGARPRALILRRGK